ncbi:lysozyme inhibitor LprI family protein [Ruegeria sp. YS9]|uniref:lysozyme inhibitor LprI family protein n=1 Tax=Ruegeria sp. YS9 TaxID=2966453 RepID=UPI00214BDD1F|nr:lysozyme inhibitor LprI family protein [Ruegeria sp. YS9]UUV05702.1 DUF1311 domain-containing protein [Ruegeria sp. YS9]
MRWVWAVFLLPVPGLADPALECSGAGSQVEIGACVGQAETNVAAAMTEALGFAADAARDLDDVTGRALALPALEASQEAWKAYRDAQCEAVGASYGGGSGTGIAVSSCRVELGRARVAELLRFVN